MATRKRVKEEVNQEVKDAALPIPPAKFRLTALMNVRKEPSLDAEIVGTLTAGNEVDVDSVVDDWLYLSNGRFIYYNGGKFAEKL